MEAEGSGFKLTVLTDKSSSVLSTPVNVSVLRPVSWHVTVCAASLLGGVGSIFRGHGSGLRVEV